ncbi:hypothetical protein GF376_01100 [Candidatus Peregrinibacteria bacterium]|nr:hypothetical protein [Candidatus Peregrinibacteria bacterium]
MNTVVQIAYAQANCTLNGQSVPCEELTPFLGAGIGIMIAFLIIGFIIFIFWLWMLIHAATKPIDNKALWIILMVLLGFPVSLIYYFIVKRNFNEVEENPMMPKNPNQN